MMIKTSLSKYSIDEQLAELGIADTSEMDKPILQESINSLISFIKNNNELMCILGEVNYLELRNLIKIHVINHNIDLTSLSDEDKLEIIGSVLMEYI